MLVNMAAQSKAGKYCDLFLKAIAIIFLFKLKLKIIFTLTLTLTG